MLLKLLLKDIKSHHTIYDVFLHDLHCRVTYKWCD